VAALAAMLVLHEFLTAGQWVAVGCVVAASVGATRTASSHHTEPVPD
jgi:inner membrane transporter RhtA